MGTIRRATALIIGTLVMGAGLTAPVEAATTSDPTTLAVEGTLRVVVIDGVGSHPHADHLYTVVTDSGAEIPVDLTGDPAANGHFSGELVVAGDVAETLDDRGLLPRRGATIGEDTRAGRVAVAAAEGQDAPLTVAESTVTAAAKVANAPAAHKAYVAVMDGRGSIEESDTDIGAIVASMMSYWRTESGGVISSFVIQDLKHFTTTTAGSTDESCGMEDPYDVWNEAGAQFTSSPGSFFGVDSRNHLIVAMADECSGQGIAGIALTGNGFSSGGPLSMTMGSIGAQVGIHELGHTFSLGHANLDQCAVSDICDEGEYYDLYSPMALSIGNDPTPFTTPALDSAFRARLGLTSAAELPLLVASTGTTSRKVRLLPRAATSGARGLQVVDPVSKQRYYVDYRSGTTRDASSFYARAVGWIFDLGGGSSYTLAYRPGVTITTISAAGELTLLARRSGSGSEGSLGAGQVFSSPTGATLIAVGALGGTGGVDVTVTLKGPAPKRLSAATPRISGTAKVGKTLKVKVGTWSPKPSFRYQWFANGRKITAKGTKSSFKLTSKQMGKRITVRVTGSKSGYATIAKTSKKTKKVARK